VNIKALQAFVLRTTSFAFFLYAALTLAYAHHGTALTPEKLLLTLGISLVAGVLVAALQQPRMRETPPNQSDP
jgi:hypothetical protein